MQKRQRQQYGQLRHPVKFNFLSILPLFQILIRRNLLPVSTTVCSRCCKRDPGKLLAAQPPSPAHVLMSADSVLFNDSRLISYVGML